MIPLEETERRKYAKAWALPGYRKYSPGLEWVDRFIEIAKPKPKWGDRVIDFGCGAGVATAELKRRGFEAMGIDFVDVREDKAIPFVQACLWKMPPQRVAHFGYCVDVMEHIPIQMAGLVVRDILDRTFGAFFHIALVEDYFGQEVGEPLHLTVMPFAWWRDLLSEFGRVVEARDLQQSALFYVEA